MIYSPDTYNPAVPEPIVSRITQAEPEYINPIEKRQAASVPKPKFYKLV